MLSAQGSRCSTGWFPSPWTSRGSKGTSVRAGTTPASPSTRTSWSSSRLPRFHEIPLLLFGYASVHVLYSCTIIVVYDMYIYNIFYYTCIRLCSICRPKGSHQIDNVRWRKGAKLSVSCWLMPKSFSYVSDPVTCSTVYISQSGYS